MSIARIVVVIFFAITVNTSAQIKTTTLSLENAIELAADSSIMAFKSKNMYLAGFWEYQTYQAEKKPQLYFNTTPLNYNRAVTKEFNFTTESYQYVEQQDLNTSFNLSINQNLGLTGGKFYIDSDLGRLQNFGENRSVQYSTTPIRVGYIQELFGYNRFKWEKKIEPIKFEKEKKKFVENMQQLSILSIEYFFDLAMAQKNLEIARLNLANADTLYSIGQRKIRILSISKADLLTLKLDLINAKNELEISQKELKRAEFRFHSFLGLEENENINLVLPDSIIFFSVSPARVIEKAKDNNPDILLFRQQQLEAEKRLEKIKTESRFQAHLSASYGLNQRNEKFNDAYKNPLDQQKLMVSLNMPIIDWGQRKGKYNLAKREHEVTLATIRQSKIDFDQEAIILAEEFNLQAGFVESAREAKKIAQIVYETNKKRFLNGEIDIYTLNITRERRDAAQLNYVDALYNYWLNYYKIRKLTLFDFEKNESLVESENYLIKDF